MNKPMVAHIQTPEADSIASVIHFDRPVRVIAIRVANKLVASSEIEAPGIDKLSSEPAEKLETKYLVEKHSRLIINLAEPALVTVEWTKHG
jgi:hypothetical protein